MLDAVEVAQSAVTNLQDLPALHVARIVNTNEIKVAHNCRMKSFDQIQLLSEVVTIEMLPDNSTARL